MANGHVAYASHQTSTDEAMVDITVRLDTARWSKRKKNIITRCVMSGVIDAGMKTSDLINHLITSYGIPHPIRRHRWIRSIDIDESAVIPSKLDDLRAVVAAGIRLRPDQRRSWEEEDFLADVDQHQRPARWGTIPVPKDLDLAPWLIPDSEAVVAGRKKLCQKIWDNQPLQVIYTPQGEIPCM